MHCPLQALPLYTVVASVHRLFFVEPSSRRRRADRSHGADGLLRTRGAGGRACPRPPFVAHRHRRRHGEQRVYLPHGDARSLSGMCATRSERGGVLCPFQNCRIYPHTNHKYFFLFQNMWDLFFRSYVSQSLSLGRRTAASAPPAADTQVI